MNKRSVVSLIVVNVVLLAALLVTTFMPQPAEAQMRGRTEYAMISGRLKERDDYDAIYIIELSTGRVMAFTYESENERLTRIDGYDFSRDLSTNIQRR
jgi:hypothetical protein